MESFGLSRMAATTAFVFILVLVGLAMRFFISSAPPSRLILTSGPEGSSFSTNAAQYQALLASNGVKLEILTSEGSEQNLQRLSSGKSGDMVGFVQGGITNFVENGVTNTPDRENIVSLGSLFYVPVFVFYRGEPEVTILSAFKGKRISVGLPGSGVHALALSLLQLNGMNLTNQSAEILELDAEKAVAGLTNGTLDAAFLMGDSASRTILRSLLDVATGMSYLHQLGIVHGDLKSANVLLKSTATDLRGFICKCARCGGPGSALHPVPYKASLCSLLRAVLPPLCDAL